MNIEILIIASIAAVVIQLLLIFFVRPKLHTTILIVFGIALGVFFTISRYFTHDELTIRPLTKSLITSALISLMVQLVFSISKIAKGRGIVSAEEATDVS